MEFLGIGDLQRNRQKCRMWFPVKKPRTVLFVPSITARKRVSPFPPIRDVFCVFFIFFFNPYTLDGTEFLRPVPTIRRVMFAAVLNHISRRRLRERGGVLLSAKIPTPPLLTVEKLRPACAQIDHVTRCHVRFLTKVRGRPLALGGRRDKWTVTLDARNRR